MTSLTLGLAATAIATTLLLTWVIYFSARALFARHINDSTQDLAGSVIFRIASMHGLILALVFAQELITYSEVRTALLKEATAIADIFADARRYGFEDYEAVQTDLAAYTRIVIGEEWQSLAAGEGLLDSAWGLRERVYRTILDLDPQTAREKVLYAHMTTSMQDIAALRQERENSAFEEVNVFFWVAAIAGVVMVTLPYFIYAASWLNVTLLSLYATYTGLVLFIIFSFSNPFTEPGGLTPVAFQRLLESEIGQM